jgi:hypothetical protein
LLVLHKNKNTYVVYILVAIYFNQNNVEKMNQKPTKMKRITQLFCLSLILLMTNCQVEEDVAKPELSTNRDELFFKDAPNSKQSRNEGNSIETFLKNENEETQFLQKLSDQKGIPIWKNTKTFKNKSLTNKNSGSSKTIIPLSDNDKNLSSLLFVDSKTNGKATIYTITNDELFKIVSNQEIPKETRETILMEFLYFDYLSFGEREYSNIPIDLFSNIKAKKDKNYKQFKISINETEKSSVVTSRQVSDICVTYYNCKGCTGPCDHCSSCVSDRCYSFGGSSDPTNYGDPTDGGGGGGSGGGGGGGTSGGSSSSSTPWYLMNPYIDIYTYNTKIRSLFKKLTEFNVVLQREQLDYLNTDSTLIQKLQTFLTSNSRERCEFANITIDVFMNNGDKTFFNWAIDYLTQNPSITISQFQNWFMGSSEGLDGEYDAAYWENSNLNFPAQSLPKFEDFKNVCPSKYTNAEILCNEIGGGVLTMYNAVIAEKKALNTCAIRMSKAFNYSGIVLPSLPDNKNGSKNSVKGADGKNYIINAKALNTWMRKTFGTNPSNYNHYTATQGGNKGINFPKLLEGKQGIYSMVSRSEIHEKWGTGHSDLLESGKCLLNCHFYDLENQFVPVNYIDVWILN